MMAVRTFADIKQPLVSVVIPCYNAVNYIQEAVQSVMQQNYANTEIIVVDDGSTDGSANLIALYPVHLIRLEKNVGECRASEIGFREAHGKYVCRLSADDEYLRYDHISRQVQEMEKHTEIDWCYNNVNYAGESICDPRIKRLTSAWLKLPIRYSEILFQYLDNIVLRFPQLCYLLIITGNPVNSSALMFRTETFRREELSWIGLSWIGHGMRTVCDGALLEQVLRKGLRGRSIHRKAGALYRIHQGQSTNSSAASDTLRRLQIMMCDEVLFNSHPLWMKAAASAIKRRLK